jgi:hypothetical protein
MATLKEIREKNPDIFTPQPGDKDYSPEEPDTQTNEKDPQATLAEITERMTSLRERVDLRVPDTPIDTTSAENLVNRSPAGELERLEKERQQRIEETQKQREELTEERKGLTDRFRDFFDTRKPMEETVREEQDRLGVDDLLQEQEQLMTDISDLRTRSIGLIEQRDAAVAALGQQGVATPFITGQQARTSEAYDRRINTMGALIGEKAAYMQALQGNVQQARALVSDIVNAATFDTELELNRITSFIDMNRDELSRLDNEYWNEIQQSQRYWENQLETERQEKSQVMEWAITHTDAGISIDDNMDTAAEKLARYMNIQPDTDVRQLMAQFPGADIKESDSFTEAINKVSKIPVAAEPPEVFGGQTTGYHTWVQDEQGNWTPQQVVGVPGRTAPSPFSTPQTAVELEPLSVLDIQRLRNMHPDAGITVGDTQESAEAKIYITEWLVPTAEEAKGMNIDRNSFIQWMTEVQEGPPTDAEMIYIDQVYAPEPVTLGGSLKSAFIAGGQSLYNRFMSPFLK